MLYKFEYFSCGEWKPCHVIELWRSGASVGCYCIDEEGPFEARGQDVRWLENKLPIRWKDRRKINSTLDAYHETASTKANVGGSQG